jgi:hypothetical protein
MNDLFNVWVLLYVVEDQPWVLGFESNGKQLGRVSRRGGCCNRPAVSIAPLPSCTVTEVESVQCLQLELIYMYFKRI